MLNRSVGQSLVTVVIVVFLAPEGFAQCPATGGGGSVVGRASLASAEFGRTGSLTGLAVNRGGTPVVGYQQPRYMAQQQLAGFQQQLAAAQQNYLRGRAAARARRAASLDSRRARADQIREKRELRAIARLEAQGKRDMARKRREALNDDAEQTGLRYDLATR